MRKCRIVADSSADLLSLTNADFCSVPMKIITAEQEFIDTEELDVHVMVTFFDQYKGRSQSSCPNVSDWLDAFGDADDIFCVTITSGLSGSYRAACAAKEIYESENEGKRVFVIDTLSAGPEMRLCVEKLAEMTDAGLPYEEICEKIQAYLKKTGLLFMLKSLKNFANNGRVSPALAKICGLVGIHIVGQASEVGQLQPLHKCRGEHKSLQAIVKEMAEQGFSGGKVHISNCENEAAAQELKKAISDVWPEADVNIYRTRGLCSFYAELGGLLIGFEKN